MTNPASPPSATPVDYKAWIQDLNVTRPRFLHTMMRVRDFDASLRFYVDGVGMKLLDRVEIESRRVSAIFVGFDLKEGSLELASPWDKGPAYTHGTGYGHIAIGVPDVESAFAKLVDMGVEVVSPPAKLLADSPVAAFVKDPDGYTVELVQARRD